MFKARFNVEMKTNVCHEL